MGFANVAVISDDRNNLHIVLAMSPVGNAFRSRCRMFPSLVNCCTIDWFTVWPEEALLSVSQTAFMPADIGSEEIKASYGYLLALFTPPGYRRISYN